jgi:hypothetical protein
LSITRDYPAAWIGGPVKNNVGLIQARENLPVFQPIGVPGAAEFVEANVRLQCGGTNEISGKEIQVQ